MIASVFGAPISTSHNATIFANPVACNFLMTSAPLLPIPIQARFTLSLGATCPNAFPNTDEGSIVTPAIPAKATLLFFKKSL